jgi:hypothetical protein
MSNDADATGGANPSGDDPGELTAPDKTPGDAGVNGPTLSSDAARAVDDRRAMSPAGLARQQRALRRAYHNRRLPSWVKYIPWVIFPVYGFMRLADPNYEEHFAQWKEEQRRNYLEGESQ